MFYVRLSALLAIALACAPMSAQAQSDRVFLEIEDESARLDAWLAVEPDLTMTHLRGVVDMLSGTLVIGYGCAFVVGPDAFRDWYREAPLTAQIYPVLFIALGAEWLVQGGAKLFASSDLSLREAWRAARGTASERDERLRIEGEFRGMARQARVMRESNLALQIAKLTGAVAGLVTILSLPDITSSDRGWLGAAFGVLAVFSGYESIRSFLPSEAEERWERYQQGLAPRSPEPRVAILPSIAPSMFGVMASGAF